MMGEKLENVHVYLALSATDMRKSFKRKTAVASS